MHEQRDGEGLTWAQFKNGDREAFALLYHTHILPLLAYGSRLCADRDLLKDQVQELFVELWTSRAQLAAPASVKFYLFSALRYKLIRLSKSRHLQADVIRMEDYLHGPRVESSIETSIVEKERQASYIALLKEAVCQLTDRQQEVIQLRFYEGFSHDQIAELMDLNHQSVSNLLYRALCRLKEKVSMPAFTTLAFLLAAL